MGANGFFRRECSNSTDGKTLGFELQQPLGVHFSSLIPRNLFKAAGEEEVVRVGRNKLVSRWQDAEAKKHEGADHIIPVGTIFSQCENDVMALKFFLGELEQRNEAFFGASLRQSLWYFQIQAGPP